MQNFYLLLRWKNFEEESIKNKLGTCNFKKHQSIKKYIIFMLLWDKLVSICNIFFIYRNWIEVWYVFSIGYSLTYSLELNYLTFLFMYLNFFFLHIFTKYACTQQWKSFANKKVNFGVIKNCRQKTMTLKHITLISK